MSSFTQVLQELGIPYATEGNKHCRPGWVQINCPQCGRGGDKYHLGFNLRGRYLHCWKCGKMPLAATLADAGNVTVGAAKKALSELEGGVFIPKSDEPVGRLQIPKGVGELLPAHRKYLCSRGYDPDEIVRIWGVQGIGMAMKLSWRLFIPITLEKRVVSWTTRAIRKDAEMRYISASLEEESVSHKTLLYGADKAKHAVCAVEGPMDVWKIGPGAVGLLGIGHKRSQVERLSRFLVRGVCFDNEPKAQERARKLVNDLSVFPGQTFNIVLDSKDPGEATDKELRQVRRALGL